MIDGRKRTVGALVTLCVAALTSSIFAASPSTAEPSIGEVQDRVEQLYHEAEQASERFNDARVQLSEAESRLGALQADLDRQRAKVETVRDQVAGSVVAQYQGEALSAAAQVMLSNDPDAFLSQLTTVSEFNDRQAQMVADLAVQVDRLEAREQTAEAEVSSIEKARASLAKEKAVIDEKASQAKALLGRMEQAARVVQLSRGTVRLPTTSVPASGRAAGAVNYALAQVGDSYVFGAAGPSAFDCSGLTMAAWGAAGVGLPHSSSAQRGYGASVSSGDLQPGDLVFYYSPISHVGIYIGNGMIVHAANPSSGVRVAPVFSMPYSGAVRPG